MTSGPQKIGHFPSAQESGWESLKANVPQSVPQIVLILCPVLPLAAKIAWHGTLSPRHRLLVEIASAEPTRQTVGLIRLVRKHDGARTEMMIDKDYDLEPFPCRRSLLARTDSRSSGICPRAALIASIG